MHKFSQAHQQINELFNNITNLQEETDQSREETFAPLADDPILQQPTQSPSSSYLKATMFTQKLSESIVKNEQRQKRSEIRRDGDKIEIIELRQINRKLFEDNKSLLRECIRLKKRNQKESINGDSDSKIRELELENLHLMNEINKIRTQNIKLRAQLYAANCSSNVNLLPQMLESEFEELNSVYNAIKIKLDQFPSRIRKSSTFDSTEDTKSIKATYLSEIASLKGIVEEKQTEISKLKKMVVVPRRREQSPEARKPKYSSYLPK